MWDRNGNYQFYFIFIFLNLFGTGTGITKKLFIYSGQERELPKKNSVIWDLIRKPKKSSHCSGMEILGVPVGNLTGSEIPAHAW